MTTVWRRGWAQWSAQRRWLRSVLELAVAVGVLGLPSVALAAQPSEVMHSGEVTLELGFGGEVVSGHWNPLRLTTRDTPNAELVISFDQSSFTEPETLGVYRAQIPGSGGVAVFEDDVFVPEWRQLVWRLVSDDTVVASGSLGRALRDARPLTLLLSANPFRWRTVLGDARVVALPAGLLPERLAAFDGVSTLLIDGSAPAPHPAALVAATSAGVQTVLVEPLPNSYDTLRALTAEVPVRLGAGWLVRLSESQGEVRLPALNHIDFGALNTALLSTDMHPPPPTPAQLPLTFVAGGYVVLVLLLLRFAGTPGLVTGMLVAVLTGVTAWLYLRPPTAQTVLSRAIVTSGGDLARRDEVRSLFTLPRATVESAGAARPIKALPYIQRRDARTGSAQTREQFEVALARWGAADLALRPQLVDAALSWQDGHLHNASPLFLSDVFVTGLGPQPDLAAGATLTPQPTEEVELPPVYQAIAGVLPAGTAIGRAGGTLYLALPAYPAPSRGNDARAGR